MNHENDTSTLALPSIQATLDRLALKAQSIDQQTPVSLADGACGILLVLLEAYQQAADPRLLDTARNLANQLLIRADQQAGHHYGLWQGKGGLIFALTELYRLSGEDHWRQQALQLAEGIAAFLQSKYANSGWYDGKSGSLQALYHLLLHYESNQTLVGALLWQGVTELIHATRCRGGGVCWDLGKDHIDGRIGHGAGSSGVAFTLAHFCADTSFAQEMIREAIAYENIHWSEEAGNWPDLYRPIQSAATDAEYRQRYQDEGPQVLAPDYHQWNTRQGTLGVLLNRALIWHYEPEIAERDVIRALQQLSQPDVAPNQWQMIDCLSFEQSRAILDKQLTGTAHAQLLALDEAVQAHLYTFQPAQEEGLAEGQAGWVLYWLMRRSGSGHPLFQPVQRGQIQLQKGHWQLALLQQHFRHSHQILQQSGAFNAPETMAEFANYTSQQLPNMQRQLCDRFVDQAQGPHRAAFKELFELERELFRYEQRPQSRVQLFIEQYFQYELAEYLLGHNDAFILQQTYQFRPTVLFRETQWKWPIEQLTDNLLHNLEKPADHYDLLIVPNYQHGLVRLTYLDGFDQVFVNFEQAISGEELILAIRAEMEMSKEQIGELKSTLVRFIIQSIQKGYLVCPNIKINTRA